MYPWSSMSNFSLRLEVDALRRDLNEHYMDIYYGRCSNNEELFQWEKARLEALQAFAHAQFVISQIDSRAIYNTTASERYGPSRYKPRKRLQRKKRTSKAITAAKSLGPVKKEKTNVANQKVTLKIKVEPDQHCADTQQKKREEPMQLMEIKLENIKQERED